MSGWGDGDEVVNSADFGRDDVVMRKPGSRVQTLRAHLMSGMDKRKQDAETWAGRASGVGSGFVRGVRDIPDAGAQLITRGIEAVSPAGSGMETWARGQRENVEAINEAAERDYQQNWINDKTRDTAKVGRVMGNVAASLPITAAIPGAPAGAFGIPRIAQGAAVGSLAGALQPVPESAPSFWGAKIEQAGSGAAGGAAGAAVAYPFSRFLDKRNPAVSQLVDSGVNPTPGQVLGGAAGKWESRAESIPFVGDVISNSKRKGIEEFNRATYNKVLEPIGKRLDDNTEVGQKAVAEVGKRVSDTYNALLPQLRLTADAKLQQDLVATAQQAAVMSPDYQRRFIKYVTDEVARRTGGNNTLTGPQYKEIVSEIGREAKDWMRSATASEREYGKALVAVQDAFKSWLYRSNPQHADALRAIDTSYAMLKRVEMAAGSTSAASKEIPGLFTPYQLLGAVRQGDRSLAHGAFARGNSLMQEWAQAGTKVLSNRYPDSGTAGRAMTGAGILAAPAIAAKAMAEPVTAAAAGGAAGLAMLPYLPGGRSLAAGTLASRGQNSEAVRQALDVIAAPGGAAWYTRGLLGGP